MIRTGQDRTVRTCRTQARPLDSGTICNCSTAPFCDGAGVQQPFRSSSVIKVGNISQIMANHFTLGSIRLNHAPSAVSAACPSRWKSSRSKQGPPLASRSSYEGARRSVCLVLHPPIPKISSLLRDDMTRSSALCTIRRNTQTNALHRFDLRFKHRLESELLATTLPSPQIQYTHLILQPSTHIIYSAAHTTSGKQRLAATPLSRGDGNPPVEGPVGT